MRGHVSCPVPWSSSSGVLLCPVLCTGVFKLHPALPDKPCTKIQSSISAQKYRAAFIYIINKYMGIDTHTQYLLKFRDVEYSSIII